MWLLDVNDATTGTRDRPKARSTSPGFQPYKNYSSAKARRPENQAAARRSSLR
jgi:hypothetical protein